MFGQESSREKNIRNCIIFISIIYLLSQGFLLVLTGTWWDDKTWFFSNKEIMWNVSLQMGKPTVYFIFLFLNLVPEFIRRCLIFVLFLAN